MTTDKWANQFGRGKLTDKRTSVWGKKLLGGTAGLSLTAEQIVELWLKLMGSYRIDYYMPYEVYCEPFAGKARTYEALKYRNQEPYRLDKQSKVMKDGSIVYEYPKQFHAFMEVYLNDISPHAQAYCKEKFPEAIITGVSYEDTIKSVDSENTFFMIDPPWRKKIYTNNEFFRCDQSIPQYYKTILNLCDTLEGDWVLASSADEHECRGVLTKSEWNTVIIKSNKKKKIFGKPARTLLCSNLIPDSMNGEEIQ